MKAYYFKAKVHGMIDSIDIQHPFCSPDEESAVAKAAEVKREFLKTGLTTDVTHVELVPFTPDTIKMRDFNRDLDKTIDHLTSKYDNKDIIHVIDWGGHDTGFISVGKCVETLSIMKAIMGC